MEINDILLALLKNPLVVVANQSTFQWIVDTANIPNRNRCRTRLTELKKKKLIKEEPENNIWRKGRKKWFSLTEKGKNKALEIIADQINESLNALEIIIKDVDPIEFEKEYNAKKQEYWSNMVNNRNKFKGKQFHEKVDVFIHEQAKPIEPIFKTLEKLHEVLTYFRMGVNDYNKYTTIICGEKNEALTIPTRLLKGINFKELFFLNFIGNRQELEIEWQQIKQNNHI